MDSISNNVFFTTSTSGNRNNNALVKRENFWQGNSKVEKNNDKDRHHRLVIDIFSRKSLKILNGYSEA